jgi:hypothetical protein
MSVVLTDAQIDFLVKCAAWKFDVAIKDARNASDSSVYAGDGVDDLDRLINLLEGNTLPNGATQMRVTCDVGRTFSQYITVTVDDVYALRARYIQFWGTVNKPPYWNGDALTTPENEQSHPQ